MIKMNSDYIFTYKECRKDNYKNFLSGIDTNGEYIQCGNKFIDRADGKKKIVKLYTYTSLKCAFDIETTTIFTNNLVDDKQDYYSAAYCMTFAINNRCIICRTWAELRNVFISIPKRLHLTKSEVLLTWVHNLDYETSYLKHRVNIDESSFFGKSRQKPIKYLCENHIYMHDSYCVTNTTLKKLAEMWRTAHKKAAGDLNYNVLRNSTTPILQDMYTDSNGITHCFNSVNNEIGYIANDVFVLTDFAGRMFEFYNDNGFIPDTSTQILSKEIEKSAILHMAEFMGNEKYNRLLDKCNSEKDMLRFLHGDIYGYEFTANGVKRHVNGLINCDMFTPFTPNGIKPPPFGYNTGDKVIYDFYEWLFRGGYAKSNMRWTADDVTFINGLNCIVGGVDYTSSYPFVQIAFNFPMGQFTEFTGDIDKLDLQYDTPDFENYRYIFIIEFHDIESIDDMAIESESKCLHYNSIVDNGRIRAAGKLIACLTDVDYMAYKMYYKWDKTKTRVLKQWCAPAAKLPKYFLIPLCNAGVAKAKLKHDHEKIVEYNLAKGKFNSSYGLSCKQPTYINYHLSNDITINGYVSRETNSNKFFGHKHGISHSVENGVENIDELPVEIVPMIDFESAMKKSILSPFWGIWTAAFARFNLLYIVKQISNNSDDHTNDTTYCDTDSVYFKNPDKHQFIIDEWNKWAAARMKTRLNGEYPELLSLGQLDNIAVDDSNGETDHYINFKTLGSKRYLKTWRDKVGKEHTKVTIAGLPKGIFENYCKRTNTDIYSEFHDLQDFECDSDDMSAETIHKLGRKYHDKLIKINVAGEIMTEYSSCTLYNTTFKIKLNDIYKNLIENIHRHEDGGKQFLNEVIKNGYC